MFQLFASGTRSFGYGDDNHCPDAWLNWWLVDITPSCEEEAIFYHHNSAYDIDDYTLLNDIADYVGAWAYYGGIGRAFRSGARMRFSNYSNRVLVTQMGGLDI